MFDWLFKNGDEPEQSLLEMITVDVQKLTLSKMAIEKAVGMIAKAIAKSEFIVQRKDGRAKDHIYWMLNVRPNPNETATDFWMEIVRKLLIESEAVICRLNGGLYLVDSFSTNNVVMLPQVYSDVTITSGGKIMSLDRTFSADDVLHLKVRNKKIFGYLKKVLSLYDDTVSAMCASKKMSSTPKFALDIPGQMPIIREKNPDGTEKILTIDEYKGKIKTLLESDDIEVVTNASGLKLEQLKIESQNTSEDIVKLANEVFTECAFAFDIPKAVFLGEVTEKADSTNEFITFAVKWVVEVINDSMNAKLVGEEAYLKGESIWIDMSRYKHVDIIESASNLDKLRSIGFNFDEVREAVGWEALNTEFSQERVITKNYTDDLTKEGKEEGG